MGKRLLLLGLGILTIFSSLGVLAADIDGFFINVQKNIPINEAIDIEVSAVKDGNVVKNFEGAVFLKLEGISSNYVTIPNGGVYLFGPGDQGKKLFSKGLKIGKAGTYTFVVESPTDSSLNTKTTLVVTDNSSNNIKGIDIISPTKDGIELGDVVDVMGNSVDLPNTPVKIYLNGEIVASSQTDENGEFSSKISLLQTGNNILQIKAFDINDTLIGKSNSITFKYEKENKESAIKEVIVEPNTTVEKASKVTVKLKTREDISVANIIFGESSYQMDKIQPGIFQKIFLAQKGGKIHLKFGIIENGEEKIIDKGTIITVNAVDSIQTGNHQSSTGDNTLLTGIVSNTIGEVIITPNSVDGTTAIINRKHTGDTKKFLISYGIEKQTLEQQETVDSTSADIKKLKAGITYYFQVSPLNQNGEKDGKDSDIIEYTVGEMKTCTVNNITIHTKKIDGKNYLTWSKVSNIEKYEIYRSDTANSKTTISDMNKIGETQDTKFEYPFDINTKEEKYAYYAIQAVCKGGQKIQIGNVSKVKTGPFDNILVIAILSGLIFSMYKLYKTSI